jgi:hypothetical protein
MEGRSSIHLPLGTNPHTDPIAAERFNERARTL